MKYMATSQIKFDGSIYEAGAVLELSDAQAAQLLEHRAIEPVHVPFSQKLKPLGGDHDQ